MARPKKEVCRDRVLQIRLTEEDYQALSKLAEKAGMKISAFSRANLLAMLRR